MQEALAIKSLVTLCSCKKLKKRKGFNFGFSWYKSWSFLSTFTDFLWVQAHFLDEDTITSRVTSAIVTDRWEWIASLQNLSTTLRKHESHKSSGQIVNLVLSYDHPRFCRNLPYPDKFYPSGGCCQFLYSFSSRLRLAHFVLNKIILYQTVHYWSTNFA